MTPRFDTATWPFLKIDMRHGACRHEVNNKRHDICYFLKSTCDMDPLENRHGNNKNSDTGHGGFLNSTCDIGDPPSRAPKSSRGKLKGKGVMKSREVLRNSAIWLNHVNLNDSMLSPFTISNRTFVRSFV